MSIEILNMKKWNYNDNSFEIALPVYAIECEATPPISNYLDAYEYTVLKFVSIDLTAKIIAKTLCITESLVEEILENLEHKELIAHVSGGKWQITNDGVNFLNGVMTERESSSSQFGFMFINAIKKEVLPFFYQGNFNRIPLYNEKGDLPERITLDKSEEETFSGISIKPSKLRDAYKRYYKISKVARQCSDGEVERNDAVEYVEELFEDIESFDEIFDEEETLCEVNQNKEVRKNMFIRVLNCPPKKAYLTMKIVIDPKVLGGYRVESPFDFNGIDNSVFLRQIQWLASTENVYLGERPLEEILSAEIRKVCPKCNNNEMDFSVFLINKLPLLKIHQQRFPKIYDSMADIFPYIQRANDLVSKETIVSQISKNIVEKLFNNFFMDISKEQREHIRDKALDDLKQLGIERYKTYILKNTALDNDLFVAKKQVRDAIGRLGYSKGNSIVEKYINIIVLNYYQLSIARNTFLNANNAREIYDITKELNIIRNKVSHDTDKDFTEYDYECYIGNVFTLINALLDALKEN